MQLAGEHGVARGAAGRRLAGDARAARPSQRDRRAGARRPDARRELGALLGGGLAVEDAREPAERRGEQAERRRLGRAGSPAPRSTSGAGLGAGSRREELVAQRATCRCPAGPVTTATRATGSAAHSSKRRGGRRSPDRGPRRAIAPARPACASASARGAEPVSTCRSAPRSTTKCSSRRRAVASSTRIAASALGAALDHVHGAALDELAGEAGRPRRAPARWRWTRRTPGMRAAASSAARAARTASSPRGAGAAEDGDPPPAQRRVGRRRRARRRGLERRGLAVARRCGAKPAKSAVTTRRSGRRERRRHPRGDAAQLAASLEGSTPALAGPCAAGRRGERVEARRRDGRERVGQLARGGEAILGRLAHRPAHQRVHRAAARRAARRARRGGSWRTILASTAKKSSPV